MDLFRPYTLGKLALTNRVVMAPMTRSRAPGGVPSDLVRTFYAQRAAAGLLITEGTAPSADGLGYARTPGLFTRAQIAAWRSVTDAVHEAGGHIVAQLMHVGRIAHPLNAPEGARVLSPSGIRAEGAIFTDQQGLVPYAAPEVMTAADLVATRDAFVEASKNAIEAGFDGVELHAANGYLLEQFLHPHTNRREDGYGGTSDARNRFAIEVVRAAVAAIGADRVAIRLSPHSTLGDLPLADAAEVEAQYTALARALRGILYLHVAGNTHPSFATTTRAMREAFGGPFISNGGLDRMRAQAVIDAGDADLVSFGRPFIANPDFVTRMQRELPLADMKPELLYAPGPEGYIDYAAA
jgi:N-ethylmaleimide reductase